ncbi:hypothetical protein G6M20_23910 [Agrobacterium salinitolerans]|nr:hypothetical protein [Agrobacterium salinitolerans]
MPDRPQLAPEGARIHLSPDEAVILFELLARWCGDSGASTPEASCFESTAESAVLHNILAGLESQLVAPFQEDYVKLLNEARRRFEGFWHYPTLRG